MTSKNRSTRNYSNDTVALHSLKESGGLEYTADVMLFSTKAQEYLAIPPARAIELTVAKNRHSDTRKLTLIYHPDLDTMREKPRVL